MSEFKVWRIVPLSMVTTCKEERDKWIEAGHDVVEFVSIELVKELESQLEQAKKDGLEAKQDQARYQYLSRKVGAVRTTDGSKYIFVNLPKCGSHVFKGSVAQHFSDAIDAAMQENQQ